MRTGSLLWTAVMAIAVPSTFFVAGCGDDSVVGGSGGSSDGGSTSGGNGTGGEGNSNPVGGSGGDGGEGGGTIVANDSCDNPGAITIGVGELVEVQGTVAGANNDHDAFCDPNDNPDVPEVVYELTVSSACNGTFTLDGVAPGFDALLSIRTDCETDANMTCANANTGPSETATVVLAAGTYYVHVGDAGSGSTFSLGISCAAAGCGDFILGAGEECDFGPTDVDDGCDAVCGFEDNDPGETECDDVTLGPAIVVDPGDTLFASGSTINGERAGIGSCQEVPMAPNLASRDNIIKVRPSAAGTLSLTLGEDQAGMPYCGDNIALEPTFPYPPGCYDRAIHVRTVCDVAATEVAGGCAELDNTTGPWWGVETLDIPVLANVDYYVFVDGWLDLGPGSQDDVGIYDLKIEL